MSLTLQRRGLVDEYNGYQFRRESMAQDSAGKLIYTHNARFEQGPFGSDKGILVEEGTKNLITSDKNMIKPIGTGTILIVEGGLPVGQYTISFDYDVEGETVPQGFLLYAYGKRALGTIPAIGLKGTTFLTFEVAEDVANTTIRLYGDISNATSLNKEVTFTNLQIEAKPYATTFTPSVRADEEIIIPTAGLLSPEQGTIEFDFKIPISPAETGMYCYLLRDFYIHTNEQFYFRTGGSPRFRAKPLINEWNRLALVFENNDLNTTVLFLNGSKYEIPEVWPDYTSLPDWWTTINIPARFGSNSATKYISNLRLSSIARTQEQLAPIDAPPTVDEYTTLYLPFNGPDNVRAAKVVTL